MNKRIEAYARSILKEGLLECTKPQQLIFKRMYSPKDLSTPIEEVVDNMECNKLDWALTQIDNTLKK